MGEKDFLVDAVAQFLQSPAWSEAITDFLEAHYAKFLPEQSLTAGAQEKTGGYTLEQYEVFQQFKDRIERILEDMISELGCSAEDLVEILENAIRNGLSGERRFFVKTLLAFEDYGDFCDRITRYAAEKQGNTNSCETSGELAEWQVQLALAQSLLDAHARGQLDEVELGYLAWAEALVGMSQSQVIECRNEDMKEPSGSLTNDEAEQMQGADRRVQELESTLIKERLKVDLLVAQRIAESNALMKKHMLHLSALDLEGLPDQEAKSSEVDLDSLFQQLDTVRDRVKVTKAKCFEFKNVSQDAMDSMYLFLKEKIHHHQDLVSHEKDISTFIFSHIDHTDAALVPLLLEWLLLESEGLYMQNQIQERLGQGPSPNSSVDEGYWTQTWDESSQAFYYFHSISGESVWEPPRCGFYDVSQEYRLPSDIIACVENDELAAITNDTNPTVADIEAKLAEGTNSSVNDALEMEKVLEKISREHDEERKRLELVFEVEKARQKEELRRRKEKKRKAKLARKAQESKQDMSSQDNDNLCDGQEVKSNEAVAPLPPPAALPPIALRPNLTTLRAEAKSGDHNILGIDVPGHGRVDLTHLLSESHAKRTLEKRGLSLAQAPNPQALLNPTSLRYLAETLAKKDPDSWTTSSPKSARTSRKTEVIIEEHVEEK